MVYMPEFPSFPEIGTSYFLRTRIMHHGLSLPGLVSCCWPRHVSVVNCCRTVWTRGRGCLLHVYFSSSRYINLCFPRSNDSSTGTWYTLQCTFIIAIAMTLMTTIVSENRKLSRFNTKLQSNNFMMV